MPPLSPVPTVPHARATRDRDGDDGGGQVEPSSQNGTVLGPVGNRAQSSGGRSWTQHIGLLF